MSHISNQNGTSRLAEIEKSIEQISKKMTYLGELGTLQIPYDGSYELYYVFDKNKSGYLYHIDESFDIGHYEPNIPFSPEWLMDVKIVAFKSTKRPITPAELYNFSRSQSKHSIALGILGLMLVCDQLPHTLLPSSLYVMPEYYSAVRDFHENPVTAFLMTGKVRSELPEIVSAPYADIIPTEAILLFGFTL